MISLVVISILMREFALIVTVLLVEVVVLALLGVFAARGSYKKQKLGHGNLGWRHSGWVAAYSYFY